MDAENSPNLVASHPLPRSMALFNALIRTHHITSRKKVAQLKKAFTAPQNTGLRLVLLRVGASPGMMYAEGTEEVGVAGWVAEVQALRYKDFQLAVRVGEADKRRSPLVSDGDASEEKAIGRIGGMQKGRTGTDATDAGVTGFNEVESIDEFADIMRGKGLERWWKRAMGYTKEEDG